MAACGVVDRGVRVLRARFDEAVSFQMDEVAPLHVIIRGIGIVRAVVLIPELQDPALADTKSG